MEIYKCFLDYEGLYEVSNYGNIKSLGNNKKRKEKLLKPTVNSTGYFIVSLCKNGTRKNRKVHQVVAEVFLNHKPNGLVMVVNHKDFNKLNNHIDNLEIVTNRENTNQKHRKSTSQYTGVCWDKLNNKWIAQILVSGKSKHLGRFVNEIEAHNAYQSALKMAT